MRGIASSIAILALITNIRSANGTCWIGPCSITGEVSRPAGYLKAVASLECELVGFDDMKPGTIVNQRNQGAFVLTSTPVSANIIATDGDNGRIADCYPSSAPIALLVGDSGPKQISLGFLMNEPVGSVGFALMGLEKEARLKMIGANRAILEDYVIPCVPLSGMRRWIGLYTSEHDIYEVWLEPSGPDTYAIDDVEIGVSAPEPTSLLLWCPIAVIYAKRLRGPSWMRRYL